MGTHSDGYVEQELLTTFVTCEGDLSDPQFNTKFARLLKQLQKLLLKDSRQYLGVVKVEPWNSVRVTFTVPKEAALRLRQLAQQGDVTLSQLGILSVQLEGDQAISLRIAGRVSGESQEIVLRTTSADTESIGSQTSVPETDHMISKSVAASASGSTASFIRTMTQVFSGTSVNQSLTAFKSPTFISPSNTNSSAFTIPAKASSSVAVISSTTKTGVPHSYHSPFITTNSSTAVVSNATTAPQSSFTTVASTINASSSNYKFSVPPPPYPNSKTTTSSLIKSSRTASDDVSTNPSPANVALSSPLLVNLLQNDGGVPVSSNKNAVVDKQKLKPPATVKQMMPTSTVKRKDGSLETFSNLNQLQSLDSSTTTFVGLDPDSQVIQRIQKVSTSEPLTMVTNVRIPVESSSSDSVIVSSGKLPNMNHLTAVTANVKQNYSSQNSFVNMFQRQISTVASNTLPNHQKTTTVSSNLGNNQSMSRVATGQSENQVLAIGQNQKFDVRVINVPSSQHQLLQSQQLLPKQLLQQQFQQSQQQLLMQQPQQQLMHQPKSVILPQSTQGAKINASVQDLNKLSLSQSTPIVSSLMVTGNRLINQFPLNQSLPQALNTSNSNDTKFDNVSTERNVYADVQGVTTVNDSQIPDAGIVMAETNNGPSSKSDGRTPVQNSNSTVTCPSLQLVKTFTLTNANFSQNSVAANTLTGSVTNTNTKLNPVLYNSNATTSDSLNNISQMIASTVANSFYTSSPSCYQNTVVTNTSAVSGDFNNFIAGNHSDDTQSALFSKSNSSSMPDSGKMYQTATTYTTQISTPGSGNSVKITQQPAVTYSNSTMQLPQYPQNVSNSFSNSANNDKPNENEGTNASSDATQLQASGEKEPQFLINPLTGEMEAMPLENSDNESDNQTDIFNSLPPSVVNNEDSCFSFTDTLNEKSNSMYSDEDDDSLSLPTVKKEMDSSETDSIKTYNGDSALSRHRVLSSGSSPSRGAGGEKIKIRLKLEKSEPINNAYKLDVLNVNLKKVDKPTSIVKPMPRVLTTSASSTINVQNSAMNTAVEEPRVPPIRLSLRGKSVAFVKKNKKWTEDGKDTVTEEKPYFNKNKMSPSEVISEKDCISSDNVELCKSPSRLCKSIEVSEETDEIKSKTTKKKSADVEESALISQSEGASDTVSSYNPILSSVRTFPTEAEVTSILRSVPSDMHNKMSLSSMKIKKKETKKKTFTRDRALILSGSVLGDDTADTFTRVINETKCSLSSQSRGKSKSNSSSLLKSVMKSTAAKEARMMNLANRNLEKRGSTGEASGMNPKGGPTLSSTQSRRPSGDLTYTAVTSAFTNKLNQKTSETFVNSQQFVPNTSTANNSFSNAHFKDMKKYVGSSVVSKKMVNCKTKEYQSPKTEIRKEFNLNHEATKKGSHIVKKTIDIDCKQQNVMVSCAQVESNPSVSGMSSMSTTNLDLSEKVTKQSSMDDSAFDEPLRKKQRVENTEMISKNGSTVDRLITLPNNKDNEVSIPSAGGESPSGHTSEQTNNQGEDSGIESMDALSEKSPNQSESPCRKDEKDTVVLVDQEKKSPVNTYCDKPSIDTYSEGCSNNNLSQCERRREEDNKGLKENMDSYVKSNSDEMPEDKGDKGYDRSDTMSPDLDDVQPFRVTPALYTYSNPEKIRQDTPSPVLEDITDEIMMSPKSSMLIEQSKTTTSNTTTSTRLKRKRKESIDSMYVTTDKSKNNTSTINRYNNRNNVSLAGKSLLEQLLIDIPSDNNVDIRRSGVSTRNTRSQVKGLSQPSPDTLSVCSTSSSSSIRTPKCSPIPRNEETSAKQSPRATSRLTSRRSRKGSESSNISNSDESSSSGLNKKRSPESASDLMKACLGFEDQNGKKIAISVPASTDCYRPIIHENSVVATSTMIVNNSKAGVGRTAGSVSNKRIVNTASTSGDSSKNALGTRPVGKRRKAGNDTIGARRSLAKSQPGNETLLVQVIGSETQEDADKSSVSSTTLRGNNRLNTAAVKQTLSTPSTSRRSVRQNHVTRRQKSPGISADSLNASNSTANASNSNNNNLTNKNNNNSGKVAINMNETSKSMFHEKNGMLVNSDKSEGKSLGKANCIAKKETVLLASAGTVCNNISEVKNNNVALGSAGATITTRGHSIKQTHVLNDSAIVTPPQDVSHTHTIPASEEVINTRRKTRSIANSNASDSEHGGKRRRNSRDGK